MKEVVIRPRGGLCNYLRVMFTYLVYARSIGARLVVIWELQPILTGDHHGYFDEYFEPVQDVTILRKIDGRRIMYTGTSCYPGVHANYTELKLLPHVQARVDSTLSALGNNFVAAHIRRTDAIANAQQNNSFTTDAEFDSFLREHMDKEMYIATDSYDTFSRYKAMFPENIKHDYPSVLNQLRQTTLEDAIVDLFVCSCADVFKRSGWSSFSDTIITLSEERRRSRGTTIVF